MLPMAETAIGSILITCEQELRLELELRLGFRVRVRF